jgi:hypothetical protein
MNMNKETIEALKQIESDCITSTKNYAQFYERVKGVITLTKDSTLTQIASDCRIVHNEVNYKQFYERVKGAMSIRVEKPRSTGVWD